MPKYLILLLFLQFSCGEQNDQKVTKSYSEQDRFSDESCKSANLRESILTQQNVDKIFQCFGWSEEFKSVHAFNQRMSENLFKELFEKINQENFAQTSRRDAFFGSLNSLGQTQGLNEAKDLLLTLFNRADIFESLKIVEKINLSRLRGEWLERFIYSTLRLAHRFSSDRFNNVELSEKSVKLKKHLILSSLDAFFRNNNIDEVIEFTKQLERLKKVGLAKQEFYRLFEFSSTLDFNISELSRQITERTVDNERCVNNENAISFNNRFEIERRIEKLLTLSKSEFFLEIIDLTQNYALYKRICEHGQFVDKVDMVLNSTLSFLELDGGYELLNSIARSVSHKGTENVISFFSSDSFYFYQEFFKSLPDESRNITLGLISDSIESLDHDDLKSFREVIYIFKENPVFFAEIRLFWLKLKDDEKLKLVDSYLSFFSSRHETLSLVNFLDLSNRKEFSLFRFDLDKMMTQELINHLLMFQGTSFADELIRFFSSDNLFTILKYFNEGEREQENNHTERKDNPQVFANQTNCFDKASLDSIKEASFDTFLSKLPLECSGVLNNYFANYIFLWTSELDQKFSEFSATPFSNSYGILSSRMMFEYTKWFLIVDEIIDNKDVGYVERIMNQFEKSLLKDGILDFVESIMDFVVMIETNSGFISQLLDELTSSEKIKKLDYTAYLKQTISSIGNRSVHIKNDGLKVCDQVIPNIGVQGCLSLNKSRKLINDIYTYFSPKNENSLLFNLLKLFSKDGFSKALTEEERTNKVIEVKELLSFLYDLTDPKTKQDITYHSDTGNFKVSTLLSERLEILLNEISFNDNYYGALFMNRLSRASSYCKTLDKFYFQLKLMNSTSGVLSRLGRLSEDAPRRMKNVSQTYASLSELESCKGNEDLKYGHIIQSLLDTIVSSSSPDSQKLKAFSKPSPKVVQGHNGLFLTKLASASFLTKAGLFLRKRYANKQMMLEQFDAINKFFYRLSEKNISLLETFLLNNSHYRFLSETLLKMVHSQYHSGNTLVDILITNSDYLVKTSNSTLSSYIDIVDKLLKYSKIKNIDPQVITHLMQHTGTNKKYLSPLKNIVDNALAKKSKNMSKLLEKPQFWTMWQDIESNYQEITVENLNLTDFKGFVLHDSFSFSPFYFMCMDLKQQHGDNKYLTNLLRFAQKRKNGKSHLRLGIEEALVDKKTQTLFFMQRISNQASL